MKSKYFVYDEKQFDKEYDVVTMERKLEETKRNRLELYCDMKDKLNLIFEIASVLYDKANERTKDMLGQIIYNGIDDLCEKRSLLGDPIDRCEEAFFHEIYKKIEQIYKIMNGEDKDEDDR